MFQPLQMRRNAEKFHLADQECIWLHLKQTVFINKSDFKVRTPLFLTYLTQSYLPDVCSKASIL